MNDLDDRAGFEDPILLYDIAASMVSKMEGLEHQLDKLFSEFQSKLKYDAHKEKIIDHLHQELQEFKGDLVKKHTQSMILDIIKIIDDIRKFIQHYRAKEASKEDMQKLLSFLEHIPSDLEDIFVFQGVKVFRSDDVHFDPARQRVMKKIKTREQDKDKTIAKSLRPGYEYGEKVIRPELVAAYVYEEENQADEEVRNADE